MIKSLLFLMLTVLATMSHGAASKDVDNRSEMAFAIWMMSHSTEEFERFLNHKGVGEVVPLYQLLRTATDWKRCKMEPFDIPPKGNWGEVASTLLLVKELRSRRIITEFEIVSAYRHARLNDCADGAEKSRHTNGFAVDIVMKGDKVDQQLLCNFWKEEGARWKMGLSLYPNGRIHIDAFKYRTWGSDHKNGTTYCT